MKLDAMLLITTGLALTLSVLAEAEEKTPASSPADGLTSTNAPINVVDVDKWSADTGMIPHVFVMAEHRKDLYGGGVRLESPICGSEEYPGRIYGAIDISSLRQPDLSDNTILSFIIVGIQGPWAVSPYVEGGFGTADVIVAILANSEDSRWGSSYASAGIAARLSRSVSTRVYYKTYFLDDKFGEDATYGLWGCAVGISF